MTITLGTGTIGYLNVCHMHSDALQPSRAPRSLT